MQTAEYWIQRLQLQPHPEGGFYKETYRASEKILTAGLPPRFNGDRNFSTAIYFLLRRQDRSLFHRIKSDEMWHFYAGSPLSIYMLSEQGLTVHTLGSGPEESFQTVVPANTWFGAMVSKEGDYALCGCTVAPGFDFQDFEFADKTALLKSYPAHEAIINLLTA